MHFLSWLWAQTFISYIVFSDFFLSPKIEAFVSVSLLLSKPTIEELRSKLTQQETNMPPDGKFKM